MNWNKLTKSRSRELLRFFIEKDRKKWKNVLQNHRDIVIMLLSKFVYIKYLYTMLKINMDVGCNQSFYSAPAPGCF